MIRSSPCSSSQLSTGSGLDLPEVTKINFAGIERDIIHILFAKFTIHQGLTQHQCLFLKPEIFGTQGCCNKVSAVCMSIPRQRWSSHCAGVSNSESHCRFGIGANGSELVLVGAVSRRGMCFGRIGWTPSTRPSSKSWYHIHLFASSACISLNKLYFVCKAGGGGCGIGQKPFVYEMLVPFTC